MLDDLTKSIKAGLYERAVSPLFGTFALSWLVWNYRAILILTASVPSAEKFEYLDTVLYPDLLAWALRSVVFPLLTAIAFIVLYPGPAKIAFRYWHTKQKELKGIKASIEDETPLTLEESRNLRRELLRAESEFDSEMSRKNTEIGRLKDLVSALETELEEMRSKSPTSIPDEEKRPRRVVPKRVVPDARAAGAADIFELIAKRGGSLSLGAIVRESRLTESQVLGLLRDLTRFKLVESWEGASSIGIMYGLTSTGKERAVAEGLIARENV